MALLMLINYLNPLCSGVFFHCYMLDECNYHFRGEGSILSLLIFSDGKSC